ncbi:hemerythrin domain-containing protein [Nocardiopsis halotolerans]|uniref:hemerythrin domain-containing protein n=1 Tax=Nocardiopsis halotolerans TaxID=124252 RepID=UPI000344954A|nr:hemerythrin domain-containing protein [Nocardiopsis halotolerans]
MVKDAITLITQDHRRMEQLFDQLQSVPEQRPYLLDEIEAILTAHSRAEEEEVYPATAEAAHDEAQIRHSTEEHHEAEQLLARLKDCDPNSEEFDDRCREFVDAVKHHVDEEESEVLPALRRAVGEERVKELGIAFSERREQELQRFNMLAPGAIPKQRDLLEEAERLGIGDRADMNADELAEAVQRAKRG